MNKHRKAWMKKADPLPTPKPVLSANAGRLCVGHFPGFVRVGVSPALSIRLPGTSLTMACPTHELTLIYIIGRKPTCQLFPAL